MGSKAATEEPWTGSLCPDCLLEVGRERPRDGMTGGRGSHRALGTQPSSPDEPERTPQVAQGASAQPGLSCAQAQAHSRGREEAASVQDEGDKGLREVWAPRPRARGQDTRGSGDLWGPGRPGSGALYHSLWSGRCGRVSGFLM